MRKLNICKETDLNFPETRLQYSKRGEVFYEENERSKKIIELWKCHISSQVYAEPSFQYGSAALSVLF